MTKLQPIANVQLGDLAFESIRSAIVRTELLPGEPLKDRELAEALQLSRTPVREALHRLEAERLVETRGRGGWVVASFREQDVRELFQLRRLLEPAGITGIEKNPDPAVISRIAHTFDDFEHPISPAQFADYFSRDHGFHTFIVGCSGNQRLKEFYSVISNHIVRGRHYLSMGAGERVDETLDEHLGVARAITDGDFGLARRILVAHLETGEERMMEQLRRKGDLA